jgi:hypothetical protein
MHARDLADLAALVAVHGQQLVSASPRLLDLAMESYWTASRCRLDRWCHNIRVFEEKMAKQRPPQWPPSATQVVEEVFVAEILTRCFTAVLSAHDQHHDRVESDPIGRNILGGHLDATRRAIRLLKTPVYGGARLTESLGLLRRRCLKWTDLLLAYLSCHAKVDDFAANPARVREFASDAGRHLASSATSSAASTMLSTGMRSTLEMLSEEETPNADLNRQIAAAVLGCFGPEFFDSHGLLRSAWLDRLQSVPDETLAMLEQWWQPAAAVSEPPPPPKYPVRWKR